jgi:centriolar protein POC1
MDQKSSVRTLATGNDPVLKRSFRGHKDTISAVSFNSNLKQVASGSLDNTVIVWNFKPQQRPFRFVGHKAAVHDVSFSPNGNLIASGSKDETVRLWHNSVEGHSSTIKAHTAGVRSVNFSCDGKLLCTSSDDKTIKIWNVLDRRFLSSFAGHSNWVRSAQFSPDARLIGSGSDDKTVKIWDVEQKSEIHTFYDHTGIINSVRFHPDGTCIASASHDKKIKIWDIRSKRLVQHYDAHADSANQIAFHPSGYYLLSASNDAKLKIWDLRQGRLSYTLYGHEGTSNAVNFSAGGDFFCSGGGDNIVMVWKSNFDETANEYIEDLVEVRPSTASVTTTKSNKRLTVSKENRPSSPTKYESKSEFKEMTFSPTKSKKDATGGIKKVDEMAYSIKDRGFLPTGYSQKEDPRQRSPGKTGVTYQSGQGQPFDYNKLPEALSGTLDKIVNQLDIITKTLQVLEMRIGVNEEQISHLNKVVNTSRGVQALPNPLLEDSATNKLGQSVRGGTQENVFASNVLHQTGGGGILTPTLYPGSTIKQTTDLQGGFLSGSLGGNY